MQLSKRLRMIADLVKPADCIADIGTDHGYIPIWLAENEIAKHVIAADVGKGPIGRARDHIRECGLSDRIEVRLGDGLTVLSPGEAQRIIIAGMGGLLMIRILSDSPEILAQTEELILSPQSDIDAVRRYLHQAGFFIETEDMTEEEGKFYTVMRCRHGKDCVYLPEEYLYGKTLIDHSHPVLLNYLIHKTKKASEILLQLRGQDTDKCRSRCEELEKELSVMQAIIMKAEGKQKI